MAAERAGGHALPARGSTLVEVMAAMCVMLIGAAGVAGLNTMGLRFDSDGRRITRATAIAQDLAQQIALWPFTDPRLTNAVTGNDDNLGDARFELERTADVSGLVDHAEADLTAGGTLWHGIPTGEMQGGEYERYWSVSFNDPANPGALLDANANMVPDGMRVAALVRWRHGPTWRRIVVHTVKVNPADVQ